MATMLNGAAVMDAALLLVAGNETCPQPQTSEHLAAVEIMKLKHLIILQNKVDLIKESAAEEHHRSIVTFVKGESFVRSTLWILTFERDGGRELADCPHLCTIKIQYRRRQRVHRQNYTHPHPGFYSRPSTNCHPFLRCEQTWFRSRGAEGWSSWWLYSDGCPSCGTTG